MKWFLHLFLVFSGWVATDRPHRDAHQDPRWFLIEEEDDEGDLKADDAASREHSLQGRRKTLSKDPVNYDAVTRYLHWIMAIGMAWQFASAGAHAFLEDTAVEAFLWGNHKPMGVVLMLAIVLRVIWFLSHVSRRPASLGWLVSVGHGAMYLLMIAVPVVALLRQYGSGRELTVLGVTLMPGFDGNEIDWMTDLGNVWHGLLGWVLLALIAGHLVAVIGHQARGERQVLRRMRRLNPSND